MNPKKQDGQPKVLIFFNYSFYFMCKGRCWTIFIYYYVDVLLECNTAVTLPDYLVAEYGHMTIFGKLYHLGFPVHFFRRW